MPFTDEDKHLIIFCVKKNVTAILATVTSSIRTFHGLNGDVLSETAARTLKLCVQDASELACNIRQSFDE